MTTTPRPWLRYVRGLIAPVLSLTLFAGTAAAQNLPTVMTNPNKTVYTVAGPAEGDSIADRLTDFAVANAVFILRHEIGHLLINEFKLPVLGREEDAADILATLWLLQDDTDESRAVLADAIGGWYLSGGGGATRAAYKNADFYDVHALDIQRSYNILCLGLGQNRMAFFRVAESMGMGAQRRATCRFDYRTAERGWGQLLEPHLRKPDAPLQKIRVIYDEAPLAQAAIAAGMQKARVLEKAAAHISETYALPRPLTLHAKTCHDENAYFNAQLGSILLCYEVAGYFGGLMPDGTAEPDQAMEQQLNGRAKAIMPAGARPARPR